VTVEAQQQGGVYVPEQLGRRVHAEASGEPERRSGVAEVVHPQAGQLGGLANLLP
jgi:hypothetical protein